MFRIETAQYSFISQVNIVKILLKKLLDLKVKPWTEA